MFLNFLLGDEVRHGCRVILRFCTMAVDRGVDEELDAGIQGSVDKSLALSNFAASSLTKAYGNLKSDESTVYNMLLKN